MTVCVKLVVDLMQSCTDSFLPISRIYLALETGMDRSCCLVQYWNQRWKPTIRVSLVRFVGSQCLKDLGWAVSVQLWAAEVVRQEGPQVVQSELMKWNSKAQQRQERP